MTLTINTEKVGDMLAHSIAQNVVDARAALAAAKAAVEAAEAAFISTVDGAVVLEDGTKVQVVASSRRAVDEDALRVAISDSQWRRVSTRKPDLAKLDQAAADGWLPEDAAGAITTTTNRHVKVTIPKR